MEKDLLCNICCFVGSEECVSVTCSRALEHVKHFDSPKLNPRGTSLDASKSSSIGIAVHGNKDIPSINEEPTHAGDAAPSKGKAKIPINERSTTKSLCLKKYSGKEAGPSFSTTKPSLFLCLGDKEDQASGGPTPPSYLTEKPTQLPKFSGKKKLEQAIDSAVWPLPEKPLCSLRCSGKKAVQAIDEVVSLPSLTMKPPLPPRHSRKKLSGGKRYCEGKSKTSDVQEWPVMYNPLHVEKYPSNRPQLEASWKGRFEILDMVFPGKFCGDFRAHLPQRPCITNDRVHQFSQQMPEVLKFEVLPCRRIWAEIFKSDFALGHDISVYFFPGHFERSIEQYDYLWRFMEKEDSVMRSCMNGVELLVFTSKQLRYAEKLNWISFLWGVFRMAKTECISTSISTNKMSRIHAFGVGTTIKPHSSNSMDRIKSLNDLEVPPGFSRREEIKRLNDLEVPTGFSRMEEIKRLNDLEVPPGFSRQEKNKRLIDLEVPSGFSRKDVSKAANDAILINFSDLVEVPVESHPALVRGSDYFFRVARPPKSLKKRGGRPK